MRKIILGVAVTLDGFIEGPNGEYDWCFTDQDYGMGDYQKKIDAIFYGRKSFEVKLRAPGGLDSSPFKAIKSYVFSNTWKKGSNDFELVSGDSLSQVTKIKQLRGRDIWLFGGASLTATLINARLVDELWLSVHPLLLGSGKLLFSGIAGIVQTRLLESKTYDTGLVSLRYALV
jgi:dihydrofolate reductase